MKQPTKWIALSALVLTVGLAGCEPPPHDVVQSGYRGTGTEQVIERGDRAASMAANEAPAPLPAVDGSGPKAGDVYENVQVLGDLSVGEFTRLMTAITNWVSPEEGCTYCHNNEGFANDDVYTKKVARVMIAMTQSANEQWGAKHTAPSGVTCYTCHRGKNVPEYVWTEAPDPTVPGSVAMYPDMQNQAYKDEVAYASLPYDPFSKYLSEGGDIRMQSDTALPAGNEKGIKETEETYGLMMHFSQSLGVNCTYCHNSRAFASWEQSPPTRLKAWHAIRMVREMNDSYVGATAAWLPEKRKGPKGDPLKLACNTCHQGAYKPLYGEQMVKHYPSLSKRSIGSKRLISAAQEAHGGQLASAAASDGAASAEE